MLKLIVLFSALTTSVSAFLVTWATGGCVLIDYGKCLNIVADTRDIIASEDSAGGFSCSTDDNGNGSVLCRIKKETKLSCSDLQNRCTKYGGTWKPNMCRSTRKALLVKRDRC
ncbi:uncharacterized protein VTP21DRAFT_8297 [Calcarisporiella thermophila]|uniref:uncharacterized protein n=1 Tax=Calcarisporiella thermophila TaxID=911321 RepID=UPI00374368C3